MAAAETLHPVLGLWGRLPVVVRAVLSGLVVAAAGTVPWALLVSLNLRHGSAIPWAVPPTALYVWLFWRYVRGAGWPRATADARRACSRSNPVASDVWGMALVAGMLGLVAMLALQAVLARLAALPQQRDIDPSKYPFVTVLAWVLMSAVVAGVTEETAFRGYMQRPIERRHGPVVAILVTGVAFGFIHFTHPEVSLALLPFYLAVAAVYGTLAHLTDSIRPSMVLHAGGNVFAALNLFSSGRSEWDMTGGSQHLVWTSGPDAAFWTAVVAAVVTAAVAVWAYAALASATRDARRAQGAT